MINILGGILTQVIVRKLSPTMSYNLFIYIHIRYAVSIFQQIFNIWQIVSYIAERVDFTLYTLMRMGSHSFKITTKQPYSFNYEL